MKLVDYTCNNAANFLFYNMNESKKRVKRQFVGMHFKCCKVYSRIYINKHKTAFVGHCPKCAAKVEIKISPTGSDTPFFSAG